MSSGHHHLYNKEELRLTWVPCSSHLLFCHIGLRSRPLGLVFRVPSAQHSTSLCEQFRSVDPSWVFPVLGDYKYSPEGHLSVGYVWLCFHALAEMLKSMRRVTLRTYLPTYLCPLSVTSGSRQLRWVHLRSTRQHLASSALHILLHLYSLVGRSAFSLIN